jgi:hypothetical protein
MVLYAVELHGFLYELHEKYGSARQLWTKFVANFLGYFWTRNLPTRCFVLSIENMDENRNQSSN